MTMHATFLLLYSTVISVQSAILPYFEETHLSLQLNERKNVSVALHSPSFVELHFEFTYRNGKGDYIRESDQLVVKPLPGFSIASGHVGPVRSLVIPQNPGHIYLGLNETNSPNSTDLLKYVYCDVLVMRHAWLNVLQIIIGWMYFAAWTVSFYPQIYLNWKRKSVVGFNLDFLCLNIVGFLAYSVFNVALYASPYLKDQYAMIHPIGVVPVFENDIFFSVHAFVICLITGIQVLIYERGGQRVSRICLGILGLTAVYTVLNVILAGANVITWLSFIYNISYIKLFVTFIKYIPQAVMNCRRRSTVGWSIGNIILDLTGGILSILQMFIIAYNYEDWGNVFGSPTKLGLGLFSIGFDIFFMVQHYCLYPHRKDPNVKVNDLLGEDNGENPNQIGSTSSTTFA